MFLIPNKSKQSAYLPPVVLTDFQIFNQPVKVGNGSPLKENINETKEIILSYSQNVFSFQFSALDFNSPQSIQYAYIMDGFDDDWIYSGNRRFVTYTNLDPGTYTFKVKATNSDGVWSEDYKSILVTVNSPVVENRMGICYLCFVNYSWNFCGEENRKKSFHSCEMN